MEAELCTRLCHAIEPCRHLRRAGIARRMAIAGLALDHRRCADPGELALYAAGDDAHEQAAERMAGRERRCGIARADRVMGQIPCRAHGARTCRGRGLFRSRHQSAGLEHDPEKWVPVFRKESCSNKLEPDPEKACPARWKVAARSYCALSCAAMPTAL